jgi:hypothetical protein
MRCRLATKQGVYIKTDHRDKNHSTGVAFVNFATTEDCHKCMAAMRAQEGGVWLFDATTNTERQLMPEFSASKRKTSAEMAADAKAKVKAAAEAAARKDAVRAAMASSNGSNGDGTSRTPVAPITGRAGKTAFTVVATAAAGAPTLAPVKLGETARKRKAEAEAARMAIVKAEFAAMFEPSLSAAAAAPTPRKPNRTQLVVSFKQVTAMPALPAPAPYVAPPTLEEDLEAGRICGPSHPDWQKQQNLLRRRAITHKAELMVAAAVPFEGYAAGEAEKKVKGLIKAAAGSKVFTPFRG